MKSVKNNDRGSALLIALALILMLSGVAMMATDRATTDIDLSYNQIHNEQAFYIAEAGLTRAVKELDDRVLWRAGFDREPFGGGVFSVRITDSSTVAGLDDTMIVVSNGERDAAKAMLEALVVPLYLYPFDYAAFGDTAMTFAQSSCTDSYNSDSGSYAATQDTLGGDIGSNGTVSIEGGSTIGGSASASEDGSIDISGTSTVLGDTNSTLPETPLPPIPDSSFTNAESGNLAPLGFTGTYTYDPLTNDLLIQRDDTLSLSSGVYYFNNITMERSAHLEIDPGATVEIYVNGNLEFGRYSSVNAGGIPSDFTILSRGDNITIAQDSEFRGLIYAPDATAIIKQNDLFYGSLVAGSIVMSQGTCIHYDRSLMGSVRLEIGKVDVVAWREM